MTFATCTINDMIGFMFDGKTHPNWDEIYLEYIDTSGIAITQEYELLLGIHNLQTRLTAIPEYVKVQTLSWYNFRAYHPTATERLAKYGYKMPRTGDPIPFLSKIAVKEKRFHHELKVKEAQLEKLRSSQKVGKEGKEARREFIRLLNHLGTKYRLDRDKTTCEELALMVKDMNDEAIAEQMSNIAKGK